MNRRQLFALPAALLGAIVTPDAPNPLASYERRITDFNARTRSMARPGNEKPILIEGHGGLNYEIRRSTLTLRANGDIDIGWDRPPILMA